MVKHVPHNKSVSHGFCSEGSSVIAEMKSDIIIQGFVVNLGTHVRSKDFLKKLN